MSEVLLTVAKSSRQILWRKLKQEDFEPVKKLICEEFIKFEPLSACIKLSRDDGIAKAIFLWESVADGQGICAYDPSNDNMMCGVSLTEGPFSPQRRAKSSGILENVQAALQKHSLKTAQKMLLDECLSFGPDQVLLNHAGDEKFMRHQVITVHQDYRRIGIASALHKKMLELSKEAGCTFCFSECNSIYAIKNYEQVGGTCLKEIEHRQYVDPITGKKIFSDCPEPHISSKLMCVRL